LQYTRVFLYLFLLFAAHFSHITTCCSLTVIVDSAKNVIPHRGVVGCGEVACSIGAAVNVDLVFIVSIGVG
jgi:hypothetical protein